MKLSKRTAALAITGAATAALATGFALPAMADDHTEDNSWSSEHTSTAISDLTDLMAEFPVIFAPDTTLVEGGVLNGGVIDGPIVEGPLIDDSLTSDIGDIASGNETSTGDANVVAPIEAPVDIPVDTNAPVDIPVDVPVDTTAPVGSGNGTSVDGGDTSVGGVVDGMIGDVVDDVTEGLDLDLGLGGLLD